MQVGDTGPAVQGSSPAGQQLSQSPAAQEQTFSSCACQLGTQSQAVSARCCRLASSFPPTCVLLLLVFFQFLGWLRGSTSGSRALRTVPGVGLSPSATPAPGFGRGRDTESQSFRKVDGVCGAGVGACVPRKFCSLTVLPSCACRDLALWSQRDLGRVAPLLPGRENKKKN